MPQLEDCGTVGPDVGDSLAKVVNAACSKRCDADKVKALVDKHKRPDNCKNLRAPLINTEVWTQLDKRAQYNDIQFQDMQKTLSAGIVPLLKLAPEITKMPNDIQSTVKSLLSDAIALLGTTLHKLSVKRRLLVKPMLNKVYTSMCHQDMLGR